MKLLILSDLHLGSPLFKKSKLCISLINDPIYDAIVLNGDVIDSWEQSFTNIKNNNFLFFKVLNDISESKKVYYVIGNHDPDLKLLKKEFPNIVFVNELQIDDLLIIHGCEFDSLVTKYSFIAKILFIPHWFGERLGLNLKAFFRNITNSISNKRDKEYYLELIKDIDKAAIKKYKFECNFLIMGHTHYPVIHIEEKVSYIKDNNITYINCGDLIHSYTYLEFNTKTKKYSLIRV